MNMKKTFSPSFPAPLSSTPRINLCSYNIRKTCHIISTSKAPPAAIVLLTTAPEKSIVVVPSLANGKSGVKRPGVGFGVDEDKGEESRRAKVPPLTPPAGEMFSFCNAA